MEDFYTDDFMGGYEKIMKDRNKGQVIHLTSNKNGHLSTNPSWNDGRYEKPQTAFCSDPSKLVKAKYGDGLVVNGLSYDYSDRFRQWDYKKSDKSWDEAKGENYTAAKHESYLCNYFGKDIELVHLIVGINQSNGYSYLVYGYRDK